MSSTSTEIPIDSDAFSSANAGVIALGCLFGAFFICTIIIMFHWLIRRLKKTTTTRTYPVVNSTKGEANERDYIAAVCRICEEIEREQDMSQVTGRRKSSIITFDCLGDSSRGLDVLIGPVLRVGDGDYDGNSKCCICLEDFEGKVTRRISNCNHSFHKECLDAWITKYRYFNH